MLEHVVLYAIKKRIAVLSLSVILMLVGLFSLRGLPVDAVPDVTNVQVSVLTPAAGLSPLEVEQYITYPIEMALNGLPNLDQIRSISRTGVSAVTVVFKDNVDIWFARYLVSERLQNARADIPEEYGTPELAPVSTGLGDIYEFVIDSKQRSPMELRTLLDWTIAPKLRQVPGVIEVNAFGGEVKQFQIKIDRTKLAAHHISLSEVMTALRDNNGAVGGGYIEKNGESIVVRGDGLAANIQDLETVVIKADVDGTPLLLNHVAHVVIGPALRFGSATQLGHGSVVTGTVMMLIGSNSREVVKAVKDRIRVISSDLPADVKIRAYTDRETFINRVLDTVFHNLLEGAGLVCAVLLVALGSVSGSLLAALAIPFAMLLAVIIMRLTGLVGTIMSLGAIDFGLLVDGAIVMLEAVLAHLAIHQPNPEHRVEAIAKAAARVAKPVAMAVSIILLVYLPLMALEGVEGKMFRPMAITVAYALAGALLFTLTTFPAALSLFLRTKGAHQESRLLGGLKRSYARALDICLGAPRHTLGLAAGALLVSAWVASTLGAEFVPRIFEGQFTIDVRRLPSVAISEAQRLGEQLEKVIARFPEVTTIVTRTGRPEVATDPAGPDEADVIVSLKPQGEWTSADNPEALAERFKRAIVENVPATFPSMSQPIENRVNTMLAGSKADIVIKLYGDDLVVLKRLAETIGRTLSGIQGTGDLRVQRALGLELLEAKIDRPRLARYGISVASVLEAIEASRVGKVVGKVFEGPKRFDVVVKLEGTRDDEEAFGSILVANTLGQLIPINQVAFIRSVEGPAVIHREDLQRRMLVEVNVRGRDMVSYVNEAKRRVERALKLPSGVSMRWGGQFENFERASARLALVVPIALMIIFFMLYVTFHSFSHTFAVFSSVPFALIGGIIFLKLRALPFSIPAGVGFIALCGVAVLNGVVMASDLQHRCEEGEPFVQALRNAAINALRPILTTAAVAALGFLPMALSNAPGAEVQRPLATVVIGGILSSTLLTIFALPVILNKLCAPKRRNAANQSTPPSAAS